MVEDEEEVHLDTGVGVEVPCQIYSNPWGILGTPYSHAVCTIPRNAFIDEAFGSFHKAACSGQAFGCVGKLTTCK